MEFKTTGGFDFTKELKEMLRKKDGIWSKWWIWLYIGKAKIDSKEL